MLFYALYLIGYFLANHLPLSWSYWVACRLADTHCVIAPRERRAVEKNIAIICGDAVEPAIRQELARDVFRNFAKYLVDFFRFKRIDDAYIARFVRVEGREHIEAARATGRGVIVLSAHIGNWELGGLVTSRIGYPLSAVVLTHQNKLINDFFTRQRMRGNVTPIEIGISLRECYRVLAQKRGVLALLGDRDFSKSGLRMNFFGRPAIIPKGPAALSCRTGAAIVPCFMVREQGDTFRLSFARAIYPPDHCTDDEACCLHLAEQCVRVIESCIAQYPSQWYIFKEFWHSHEKDLRPDTII